MNVIVNGSVEGVAIAAIAVGGLIYIARDPSVLAAFNPYYGIRFLLEHGVIGLITLGAVFLAVTGAEALYADLGHFGRSPIQFAWVAMVLPSLAINYLGQGAVLLRDEGALENPFFALAPDGFHYPLVALATLDVPAYEADKLPPELAAIPVQDPGSRRLR